MIHPTADYRLSVDGRDVSGRFRPRLISLTLTEKRGEEADELQIDLDDTDGRVALPSMGARLALSLGWSGQGLIDKGAFTVDEVSHTGAPDRISLRARSADLTRAFRIRTTRTWSETDLRAVLGDLAARHGLLLAADAALAGRAVDHLEQGRESDSAFLARLGRLHDAIATIKAGRLVFAPADTDRTPGGQAIPAAEITKLSGDRHRFRLIERGAYSGVIAHWRDREGARRRQVVAGTDENARRLGRTYATEAAAMRAAQAEWTRIGRGKAEFSLELARGRPDLYPQRRLTVSGFKPEIDGQTWLIDEAVHGLGENGLTTSLRMERG